MRAYAQIKNIFIP